MSDSNLQNLFPNTAGKDNITQDLEDLKRIRLALDKVVYLLNIYEKLNVTTISKKLEKTRASIQVVNIKRIERIIELGPNQNSNFKNLNLKELVLLREYLVDDINKSVNFIIEDTDDVIVKIKSLINITSESEIEIEQPTSFTKALKKDGGIDNVLKFGHDNNHQTMLKDTYGSKCNLKNFFIDLVQKIVWYEDLCSPIAQRLEFDEALLQKQSSIEQDLNKTLDNIEVLLKYRKLNINSVEVTTSFNVFTKYLGNIIQQLWKSYHKLIPILRDTSRFMGIVKVTVDPTPSKSPIEQPKTNSTTDSESSEDSTFVDPDAISLPVKLELPLSKSPSVITPTQISEIDTNEVREVLPIKPYISASSKLLVPPERVSPEEINQNLETEIQKPATLSKSPSKHATIKTYGIFRKDSSTSDLDSSDDSKSSSEKEGRAYSLAPVVDEKWVRLRADTSIQMVDGAESMSILDDFCPRPSINREIKMSLPEIEERKSTISSISLERAESASIKKLIDHEITEENKKSLQDAVLLEDKPSISDQPDANVEIEREKKKSVQVPEHDKRNIRTGSLKFTERQSRKASLPAASSVKPQTQHTTRASLPKAPHKKVQYLIESSSSEDSLQHASKQASEEKIGLTHSFEIVMQHNPDNSLKQIEVKDKTIIKPPRGRTTEHTVNDNYEPIIVNNINIIQPLQQVTTQHTVDDNLKQIDVKDNIIKPPQQIITKHNVDDTLEQQEGEEKDIEMAVEEQKDVKRQNLDRVPSPKITVARRLSQSLSSIRDKLDEKTEEIIIALTDPSTVEKSTLHEDQKDLTEQKSATPETTKAKETSNIGVLGSKSQEVGGTKLTPPIINGKSEASTSREEYKLPATKLETTEAQNNRKLIEQVQKQTILKETAPNVDLLRQKSPKGLIPPIIIDESKASTSKEEQKLATAKVRITESERVRDSKVDKPELKEKEWKLFEEKMSKLKDERNKFENFNIGGVYKEDENVIQDLEKAKDLDSDELLMVDTLKYKESKVDLNLTDAAQFGAQFSTIDTFNPKVKDLKSEKVKDKVEAGQQSTKLMQTEADADKFQKKPEAVTKEVESQKQKGKNLDQFIVAREIDNITSKVEENLTSRQEQRLAQDEYFSLPKPYAVTIKKKKFSEPRYSTEAKRHVFEEDVQNVDTQNKLNLLNEQSTGKQQDNNRERINAKAQAIKEKIYNDFYNKQREMNVGNVAERHFAIVQKELNEIFNETIEELPEKNSNILRNKLNEQETVSAIESKASKVMLGNELDTKKDQLYTTKRDRVMQKDDKIEGLREAYKKLRRMVELQLDSSGVVKGNSTNTKNKGTETTDLKDLL